MRSPWAAILILLIVAACTPEPSPSSQAVLVAQATFTPLPAQSNPAAPVNDAGEALVARVNDRGITRSTFERALARAQQGLMAADPRTLETTVLDQMIEQVLIEQAAEAANITVSEAAVEAEYQANRAFVDSDEAWQAWLTENLFTEDEFREQIRALLIAGAMRDEVVQEMPETAIQVHARHILVDTETAAHDILARLQNGEDFAALSASLSQDITTRDQGGDLGWFVEGELLEPALSQVAFALEDGQIGGPVATRLGYHVVQKLESEERPLEAEKRVLLARIQFENWVRGLTFNAIVERYLA